MPCTDAQRCARPAPRHRTPTSTSTSTSSSTILSLLLAVLTLSAITTATTATTTATATLSVAVNQSTGTYAVVVDGQDWLASPAAPSVCVAGTPTTLHLASPCTAGAPGHDPAFGSFTAVSCTFSAASGTNTSAATMVATFKTFAEDRSLAVVSASFPQGLDTRGCGDTVHGSTAFPGFAVDEAQAPSLGFLSWRGTALGVTAVGRGLANFKQTNALDLGPVVAFAEPAAAGGRPSGQAVMWSSLDHHKIVVQTTSTRGFVAPVASMWSAERNDQLACLSDLCFADQKPTGHYEQQRVEGYGFSTSPGTPVELGGVLYDTVPLRFAYSAIHEDNIATTSKSDPDATYTFHGEDGAVLANGDAPGSIPLKLFSKKYSLTHTDYATLASPAGLAWAQSNGYTEVATLGYVLASQPANTSGAVYSLGISAAIPSLPAGFTYSVLFAASNLGPTGTVYAWGDAIQRHHNTSRSPSVTLSDIGYYTDDGAYYYVWEAFNMHARPWPAEKGLILVKEDLWQRGVPVAYMQLDDWWYQGPFYFGNVKSVVDWHPSSSSRLFPSGHGSLVPFQQALGLPLQLYVPFWNKAFNSTGFNFTASTVFPGTKLVTPNDSYRFFTSWFDLGDSLVGAGSNRGAFAAFEIDFLDANFQGSASMFETVDSADRWYSGMARAALEHDVVIQYCLPSPTDMLQSLYYPAVVQARASQDYVNVVGNAQQLGGSSLLMGACAMAPSKDTLWTRSPQPPTYSDGARGGDYTTQPHVILDAILATLSLGPVGISDGLGQVDVALISQAFVGPKNSTLLRPSRPLSLVDAFFYNTSLGLNAQDVRSTHAALAAGPNSHLVVAWRSDRPVTLGPFDIFPAPAAGTRLAVRRHIVVSVNSSTAQDSGCVEGKPAAPACAAIVPAVTDIVIPATGTDLSNCSLTSIHESMTGAHGSVFFLGELTKFVHVSPQRFAFVRAGGTGRVGLQVGVRGAAAEKLELVAIDAAGLVRITPVTIPAANYIEIDI